MNLLETYEAMKRAQLEKIAEEQQSNEELEVLYKYAAAADELLASEFGNDYTEDDVVELATKMINHDLAQQEQIEKVAELEAAGRIMAMAFKDELLNG